MKSVVLIYQTITVRTKVVHTVLTTTAKTLDLNVKNVKSVLLDQRWYGIKPPLLYYVECIIVLFNLFSNVQGLSWLNDLSI